MLDKSVIQRWIKVLSNVRQECCPTLDKGVAGRQNMQNCVLVAILVKLFL